MPEEKTRVGLTKEQKTGFVLLLIFGILAVVLGILQIRNTMYGPFALKNTMPYIAKDKLSSVDSLRYRDTDKDGLNDFDELYIYGTSRYLDDTDSDGVKDGDEVKKGTNPICEEGKACSGAISGVALPAATTSFFATATALGGPVTPQDIAAALSDAKQIRQMLIEAGMKKETLDKISDSQLVAAVGEIMNASTTLSNMPKSQISPTSSIYR